MANHNESDWKLMRKHEASMLEKLTKEGNERSVAILENQNLSHHERYLALWKHLQEFDEIVADCFNDWRRSTIHLKILMLHRYRLLDEEILNQLSESSKNGFDMVKQVKE